MAALVRADRTEHDAAHATPPTVPPRRQRQELPVVARERSWARATALVGRIRRRCPESPVPRTVQRAPPAGPKPARDTPPGADLPADRRSLSRGASSRAAGAPAFAGSAMSEPAHIDRATL